MVLYPDKDPENADWTKRTWDVAFTPAELRRGMGNMTPAQFRTLPAYHAVDRPAWVERTLREMEREAEREEQQEGEP